MTHSDWSTFKLGDFSSKIGSGATPRGGSGVYLDRGPFALIRSQNVYNDGFHHEGLVYISDRQAHELSNVEVQSGDVLLNITGDSVARCCQVDDSVLPARVNQHVSIIRPIPQKLDAKLLRYWLVSPRVQAQLLSWAGSGGTRNALTKSMIESFEVTAPDDLREQHAIASVLGTLDDKIELAQRMSQTLDAMARGLFKSWFVDFEPVRAKAEGRLSGVSKQLTDLFPNEFEESDFGECPKGWSFMSLPEVVDFNPPRTLARGENAPYLDMANMPTQGHSPDEVVDRPFGSGMRFINGDTLVARITPCLENGKTAYVDFLKDGQVAWGSTEYIVLRPKSPLPEEYAYCLARSQEFRDFAIQAMTGTSGRQRVPVNSLSHFVVALPSERVAGAFGRLVKPLFARARAAVEQNRTLACLRDELLPKLVSGELRIAHADHIVRSV
jgi:type I restriction enzyme, S subunit